jgi:ABC-type Zn uptake system ZnuABC Zn-binding protein ZnuA
VVAGVTTGCSKAAPSGGSAPARRIDGAPLGTTAPGRPQRSERVLDVVATTSVVADWLRVVGGTNVRTRVIVKSGLDPTSYLATSADIATVQAADLVVAVGRGLEPWLDAVRTAAATDKPLVTLTEGLPQRRTSSGADDPYLWLDPANAKQMVAAVTAALVSVDPAGEAAYAAARDRYATDLDQADEEARRVLGPVAGRGLVTAKETFGWFAARYGLEMVGAVVPSLDGRADIPPRHLASLRQAVRTKQVAAVFVETSVPDDSVRRLAEDAGIKAVIGPDALLGDGLGPAGTPTDTFLGAFAHNVRSIATHLA